MSGLTLNRSWKLLAVCIAAVALLGATALAAKPHTKRSKPKLVTVNDFYFSPTKVTIKKGQSVKWVWSATNTYPHDVHLKQGPKKLKNKASYSTKTTAVTNAEFTDKFNMPGTYKFICTIHPTQMKMTVVVKK